MGQMAQGGEKANFPRRTFAAGPREAPPGCPQSCPLTPNLGLLFLAQLPPCGG